MVFTEEEYDIPDVDVSDIFGMMTKKISTRN
jgi:hypothetical protein